MKNKKDIHRKLKKFEENMNEKLKVTKQQFKKTIILGSKRLAKIESQLNDIKDVVVENNRKFYDIILNDLKELGRHNKDVKRLMVKLPLVTTEPGSKAAELKKALIRSIEQEEKDIKQVADHANKLRK